MQQPLPKESFTYADYCEWTGEERWELIDGVPYAMAPAPTDVHQEILLDISTQVRTYLRGKTCKAVFAPFDVRLNPEGNDDNVVQPDLLIVCDPAKISKKGCKGAPDMIAEILSPSTSLHDRLRKFNAYLKAGVREYWIVDPIDRVVHVHLLHEGKYTVSAYGAEDSIPVAVLDDLSIDMKTVFPETTEESADA